MRAGGSGAGVQKTLVASPSRAEMLLQQRCGRLVLCCSGHAAPARDSSLGGCAHAPTLTLSRLAIRTRCPCDTGTFRARTALYFQSLFSNLAPPSHPLNVRANLGTCLCQTREVTGLGVCIVLSYSSYRDGGGRRRSSRIRSRNGSASRVT